MTLSAPKPHRDEPAKLVSGFPQMEARSALICLSLAMAIFATFWPAVNFGFINMDDDIYVTANSHVLAGLNWENLRWAFAGLWANFWHPLIWLSYMLDVTLFGQGASGFHFTNLLLHAANTVLVFLLVKQLTGATWRSVFVAALFGLHPLRVEPTVWVSERKELLGAFFGLLTLLMYACHAKASPTRDPSRTKHFYWLALAFFLCGLMSKPMVVTLPVVMLLLDYWPLGRVKLLPVRQLLVEKWPFFAASFAVGLLTTVAANFHVWHTANTPMPLFQYPFPARLANATISYVQYLFETIWPFNLAPLYPFPTALPLMTLSGAMLVLIIISIWVFRSGKPYLVMGWTWYLLTLLPATGILQFGPHSHADRYVYLPLIGIFLAATWAATELTTRRRTNAIATGAVAILILIACVARTRDQLQYWRDSGRLFAHTVAVTRDNLT